MNTPAPPSPSALPPRPPARPARWPRVLGWFFLLIALALLSLWLAGRVLSDRYGYSQYVAWIPVWVLLPPALACVLLALPVRWARRDGRPSRLAKSVHTLAGLWAVGAALHFALADLGLHRAIARPIATGPGVRVMHWNLVMPDAEDFVGSYADLAERHGRRPDVFFLTTSQPRENMERSAAALEGYTLAYDPPFTVWSRFPILRARLIPLFMNAPGGPTQIAPAAGDAVDPSLRRPAHNLLKRWWNTYGPALGLPRRRFPEGELGYVMPVTLDTSAVLGRPITVWFIDLPSDPFVFRWEIARFARDKMLGLMKQTDPDTGGPMLPTPDLILGDTNIPRGSASLDLICSAGGEGFVHAFDEAGWGLRASWPRAFPVFHLDHTFVAPWLQAVGYRLAEPPVSDHWFQLIDVQRR